MRKLFLALALVAALPACQTIHNVDQAVALANQDVGDYTILDEKSWYYAEALYNVPAQAYLSADAHGLLHEPLKGQLKAKLQQANALRQAVYQAYKTGNAATFRAKIAELKALSDQVRNLIPKGA
jgi:hypothetical protein